MRSAVVVLVILTLVAVAAFLTERWHPPARARRARASLNSRPFTPPARETVPAATCRDCIWEHDGQPVQWPCGAHYPDTPGDDWAQWLDELTGDQR